MIFPTMPCENKLLQNSITKQRNENVNLNLEFVRYADHSSLPI